MGSNLLIAITIIAWGVGSVLQKLASNNAHPVMIGVIQVGLYIVLLPLALIFFKVSFSINQLGFWYSLVGGAFMCLGSIASIFILKMGGGAGETVALTSVYPVVTLLISASLLGEPLTIKKVLGCLAAVVAVVLLTNK